jgi:methylated-DNA-[protein]-cysteine S-methyltransferase
MAFLGENMTHHYAYYESPLGQTLLTASESALTGLHFVGEKYYPGILPTWRNAGNCRAINSAMMQLDEYFLGKRSSFNLVLAPEGTGFQQQVWNALMKLRYGETATYGEIALRLENPKAVRAVGAANGRNPISIIIPCHRVIGANGSLTGYAGGLARKHALLKLEAESSVFVLAA